MNCDQLGGRRERRKNKNIMSEKGEWTRNTQCIMGSLQQSTLKEDSGSRDPALTIHFIKNEGFKPLNTHTVYSVDGTHGFMADTLLQYCVGVGDSAFGLADWGEGSSLQAGRLESVFQLQRITARSLSWKIYARLLERKVHLIFEHQILQEQYCFLPGCYML